MEIVLTLTAEESTEFSEVATDEGITVKEMVDSMIRFYVHEKYSRLVSRQFDSKVSEYTAEEKAALLAIMPEPASKALKG